MEARRRLRAPGAEEGLGKKEARFAASEPRPSCSNGGGKRSLGCASILVRSRLINGDSATERSQLPAFSALAAMCRRRRDGEQAASRDRKARRPHEGLAQELPVRPQTAQRRKRLPVHDSVGGVPGAPCRESREKSVRDRAGLPSRSPQRCRAARESSALRIVSVSEEPSLMNSTIKTRPRGFGSVRSNAPLRIESLHLGACPVLLPLARARRIRAACFVASPGNP